VIDAATSGGEDAEEDTMGAIRDALASAVWPWLLQRGQGRGGFYSYEELENLAGWRRTSVGTGWPERLGFRIIGQAAAAGE
jgi:hypothetical protein